MGISNVWLNCRNRLIYIASFNIEVREEIKKSFITKKRGFNFFHEIPLFYFEKEKIEAFKTIFLLF